MMKLILDVTSSEDFANYLSTDTKLQKTQLSKMIQLGEFLGRLFGPLFKTGLPIMENVIKPLAKSVLIPLALTAAASIVEAGMHKKSQRFCNSNTNNIE